MNNQYPNVIVLRKIYLFAKIVFFILCLAACSSTSNISSRQVPFRNCIEDFDEAEVDEVELYFIGGEALPYVDVSTYIRLLDPMSHITESDIAVEDNLLVIEYNPIPEYSIYFSTHAVHEEDPNYSQTMVIDFESDTITVSSFLFFLLQGMQNEEEHPDTVNIVDVEIEEGNEVVIPFGDYEFDFMVEQTEQETQYLIPFHVASLLFTYASLYKTYYNGDEVIGGGRCIYDYSYRTSSYNGSEIPEEIRRASFNLFTIALDYFSTSRFDKEVESYRTMFLPKLPTLLAVLETDYYTEFTKLLLKIDDLHTDLPSLGYYSSDPSQDIYRSSQWYLTNRKRFYNNWASYSNEFKAKFQSLEAPPTVRLLDDDRTAVIHLYQFSNTMPDEFKQYMEDLPPSVENVVVDLSMNGGGNVNAVFRLLGYMTDEPIVYRNGVAIDNSMLTYTVEVDQDAYDYNWYILTSTLSYSAASITPLIAQENEIAMILGEGTSGGASPIESIILPCGYSHSISGNFAHYSTTGTSEFGVVVDVAMENFLDDEELLEIIQEISIP